MMRKLILVILVLTATFLLVRNQVNPARNPSSISHKEEYFPESKFGSPPKPITKEEVLKKHPELTKEEPKVSEECTDEEYVPKKEKK